MAKHDCICTKFASAIERRFNWLLDREDDHDYISQEISNQQVSHFTHFFVVEYYTVIRIIVCTIKLQVLACLV